MPSLKSLVGNNIRLRDMVGIDHVARHAQTEILACRHDKVGECPYCKECEGGK